MPTARRLLAAAVEGGSIFTFGGCGSPCFDPLLHPSTMEETRVEVYDPRSRTWSHRPPMPTILFGAVAVAPGDGAIYTFGGYVSGNVVQRYEPDTESWSLGAPMPTPRFGLAAVALDGRIYAIGGSGGDSGPSSAVEIYDPGADRWTRGADLPTARVFLAAAALDGRIYAIGGSPDCCGGAQTDVVEVYDPAANAWSTAAPLPVAQQLSGAAAVNGRIYVFGGFIPGRGAQATTYEYDPSQEPPAWSARATMPAAHDQAAVALLPSAHDADGAVLAGKVHVLGGATACHCRALSDNPEYTPPSPAVETAADLVVELTASPDPACVGERVGYEITVRNEGPAGVAGALLRASFPTPLRDVRWRCTAAAPAACRAGGSGRIVDTVTLPAGGQVVYTVTGTVRGLLTVPAAGTSLVADATITPPSGVEDPEPGNNSDQARTLAVATTDLAIAKDDGVVKVSAGDVVVYEIPVTNRGPCAARQAKVVDRFPSELEDVRWSCRAEGGARCAATTGSGDLVTTVDLPPLSRATFVATARVAPPSCQVSPCPTTLVNQVSVAPGRNQHDPAPSDNEASDLDDLLDYTFYGSPP